MNSRKLTESIPDIDHPAYTIEIDDVDVMQSGLGVQNIVVFLNLDSFGTFSVVFTDNASGPSIPALVDNDLFDVGKKVSIKIGYEMDGLKPMIEGVITKVKAYFPSDESPFIEIIGDDLVGFGKVKQRRTANISKKYGEELLSFNSEMDLDSQNGLQTMNDLAGIVWSTLPAKKNEKRKRSKTTLGMVDKQYIVGIGECLGDVEVVPGRKIKLEGLGETYSRQYRLIEAIHMIDRVDGYRTTFSVTGM